MPFFNALTQEAKDASTGWAFLFLVAVVILSRARPGAQHKRLPSSVGLFAIHAVLLRATAALVATDADGAREARFATHEGGGHRRGTAHAVFVTEENKKRKELKTLAEGQRRIDAIRALELLLPIDEDELNMLAHSLHPAPFTKGRRSPGKAPKHTGCASSWSAAVVWPSRRTSAPRPGHVDRRKTKAHFSAA